MSLGLPPGYLLLLSCIFLLWVATAGFDGLMYFRFPVQDIRDYVVPTSMYFNNVL